MTHPENPNKPKRRAIAIASQQHHGQRAAYWLWIMAALFIVSAFVLMPSTGFTQENNTPSASPTAGAVPGGSAGTTSDSDLWRALKSGAQATTSGQDKKAGVAIQANGENWRRIRNGSFATYSAWGLLGTIALLSIFFALRGRIRIGHGGASGDTISRFKLIERLGHWLLASSFIVLALTGLNLVYGRDLIIPLLGKDAFATISIYGKLAHNYVAFSFMVALVWVTLTWIWHNIPHPRDLLWFAQGGGLIGLGHPAAKKFNAGQKVIFWLVVLGGFSLSLSGWALLFPFTTTHFADTFGLINSIFGTELPTALTALQEQQLAQLWHGIMSVVMTCVVLAHIYIGSVGMEGAFDAMGSGEVDRNWAMEHHSLWVEEEDAKSAPASSDPKSIQPAE